MISFKMLTYKKFFICFSINYLNFILIHTNNLFYRKKAYKLHAQSSIILTKFLIACTSMILGEDHTKQLISNSPRAHIFYALKKYTKIHGEHFINSNKM